MAKVTFNMSNKTINLNCLGDTQNIPLVIQETPNWKRASIEYSLGDGAKWVFKWEQYSRHEQFFVLHQYLPWTNHRPQPIHYKPWTVLAKWSYIADPSRGTIQTNNIYKTHFYNELFPELNYLTFEMIGMADPKYNWNTDDYSCEGKYYR